MSRTQIQDPKSIETVQSFARSFLNYSQGPISDALRGLGHSVSMRSGRLVSFDADFDLSTCTVAIDEEVEDEVGALVITKGDGTIVRLEGLRPRPDLDDEE